MGSGGAVFAEGAVEGLRQLSSRELKGGGFERLALDTDQEAFNLAAAKAAAIDGLQPFIWVLFGVGFRILQVQECTNIGISVINCAPGPYWPTA